MADAVSCMALPTRWMRNNDTLACSRPSMKLPLSPASRSSPRAGARMLPSAAFLSWGLKISL